MAEKQMKLETVEEILDFAIQTEEEAAQFYAELASRVEQKAMGDAFRDFSREEMEHKRKLMTVKGGKVGLLSMKRVVDLKIGDYLVDITLSPHLDYKQALIIAMKAEKAAFRLYNNLAATTDDEELRAMLLMLAQEEARHKLRFEIEYEDYYLREN
jgi:rubrerythrin